MPGSAKIVALQLAIAAGTTCFATVAFAQAPDAALSVKKITDNLYGVQGGGGNLGITIGQNGDAVATKTTLPAGKGVVDEVGKLTNKPSTTVIVIHSDRDHVNGRRPFRRA